MIRQISTSLANTLVANKYVDQEDHGWYVYGFEMLFSRIINYSMLFLVGLLCGKPLLSLLYMGIVFLMRGYTGGFHAKSSFVCMASSLVLLVGVLQLTSVIPQAATIALLLLLIPCGIVVFLFAPVNHPDLVMDEAEIRKNKVLSRLAYSVTTTLTVILFFAGVDASVIQIMCFAIITVAVLILLAKIVKQEVGTYGAEENQRNEGSDP